MDGKTTPFAGPAIRRRVSAMFSARIDQRLKRAAGAEPVDRESAAGDRTRGTANRNRRDQF
jgi:hypothetical protein